MRSEGDNHGERTEKQWPSSPQNANAEVGRSHILVTNNKCCFVIHMDYLLTANLNEGKGKEEARMDQITRTISLSRGSLLMLLFSKQEEVKRVQQRLLTVGGLH